jgi:hypothetical protein
MQRLDNEYMMRSSEAPSLKRLPSEYIRGMFFTSQPMETVGNRDALELTFKMINADTQLLYSSQYPHWLLGSDGEGKARTPIGLTKVSICLVPGSAKEELDRSASRSRRYSHTCCRHSL